MKKRMNKLAVVLGISFMLGLTACGSTGTNASTGNEENNNSPAHTNEEETFTADLGITKTTYNEDEFTNGYSAFSLKLLQSCATESGNDKNVMISPASVMFALEMTEAGAVGQTGEEITAMINPNAERSEVQSFAIDMAEKLKSSETVDINVANSVWINDEKMDGRINGEYVSYLEDNFGALSTTLTFNDAALDEINAWVEDETNGMIDNIINEFTEDSCLLFINAIAFEGNWSLPYEDGQVSEGTFTNSDGTTSDVTMLNGTQDVYFESDTATGFMQYYEGGEYAFVAMLPNEDQSANDFIAGLTAESFQQFLDSKSTDYLVYTQMPEFTSEYSIEMKDILAGPMGMPTAFCTDGSADFTNMLLSEDDNVHISRVIHKTYIELDRTGTSAAAVTAIEMTDECCCEVVEDTKEVTLDRPFAYAIVDTETMTPIFIGTMNVME